MNQNLVVMGSLKHYETVRDSLVCYDLFSYLLFLQDVCHAKAHDLLAFLFTRNSERLAYLLRSLIRNQEFHFILFTFNFGTESGISHYVIYV